MIRNPSSAQNDERGQALGSHMQGFCGLSLMSTVQAGALSPSDSSHGYVVKKYVLIVLSVHFFWLCTCKSHITNPPSKTI